MTALLRFEGVTLSRGGRTLFQDLDFELGEGEALHVAGPNGSGKSSLIRLAAGLLKPDRGHVGAARAALADEKVALDGELPLRRAVKFWIRSPDAALTALALDELAHVPVRLLSSGQLKRAALARVAGSSAPLWLLDEPLNALDTQSSDRLWRLVSRHLSDGGAVVAASHQPLPGDWRTLDLAQ